MANPLVYGGTQPNVATAPVAAVNSLAPAVKRQKNTFYTPYQFLSTEKWADINPFLCINAVPNDDFQFKSNIDQRPQSTFASPLMSEFRKHRGYFAVPMSVIYPRLWSKIFVNPKKGDDVDFDKCRAMFSPYSYFENVCAFIGGITSGTTSTQTSNAYRLVFGLYMLNLVFGKDSLFSILGLNCAALEYSIGAPGQAGYVKSPSIWRIFSNLLYRYVGDNFINYYVRYNSSPGLNSYIYYQLNPLGLRRLFDDIQSGYIVYPKTISAGILDVVQQPTSESDFVEFTAAGNPSESPILLKITNFTSLSKPINIEPIIAYQMSCAQFFTSDDVDDIFTAEVWYQNMNGLSEPGSFYWNGLSVLYEPYSANTINALIGGFFTANYSSIHYFQNLFEKRTSLRYGDMFNAARLEPLAVGDVTAPVSDNSVSAVDMTRATLMQRFLNAVNSVRNTIRSYSQMLFGVQPDDVPLEPRFIAHSVVPIGSTVVANTAENQGNLETNLVLHDSRNEFDIHVNQSSIILGLSWYDCLQAYPLYLSPFAFHVDRFDDFNPMIQDIGDQPVRAASITNSFQSVDEDAIFGYLQNDYEYKQCVSYAVGGYVDGSLQASNSLDNGLSSWAFIRNMISYGNRNVVPDRGQLNSLFIRNRNYEFDQFYKSLSGFGAGYFHFVCSYVNELTSSRPMNYVSGVLFNSAL